MLTATLPMCPTATSARSLISILPKDGTNLPLIINIHGGAFKMGSKEQGVPTEYLAQGYAVASINYRLSQHAKFPAQIEDCKAAVRWLRAHADEYRLDPNHFAAWGASAGGHLAAMLGTTGDTKEFDVGANLDQSSRVQAVVDYFGPTDFLQMDAHRLPNGMVHDPANSPESELIGGAIQENKAKSRQGESHHLRHAGRSAVPHLPRRSGSARAAPPERAARSRAEEGRRAGDVLHGQRRRTWRIQRPKGAGDDPGVPGDLLETHQTNSMSLRANPRSFLLALLLLSLGWCQADDLEQGFSNPPDLAKPGVWWHWMGCNVTKAGITRDLEAFKQAGIGGATIFGMADVCSPWAAHIENSPTDGLIAFTDPWWEMVRHAAAEGKRLGIDVGLHNCPGYTSTGGPWITPELAMQQIFQSETRVEGGAAFDGLLPRPKVDPRGDMLFPMVNKQTGVLEKPVIAGRTNYWRDIAVLAVPAEGIIAKDQVVDLTSKMDASGRLAWTPPPGKWIIYRFGHTTMGALTQPNQWETMGLECDKMSEQAVTFHLQHVIGELKKHLGPLVGTGLQHILLDSYEAGKPSWTPLMPQEFAQRRGYDLKAFLPTFAKRVVGSDSETKKFRSDFDRTIADLYRDKLFATMSRMLADANLRFVCEPYGGPFQHGRGHAVCASRDDRVLERRQIRRRSLGRPLQRRRRASGTTSWKRKRSPADQIAASGRKLRRG